MALNTETHNWVKYRELGINCRIMESKCCISITTPPYPLLPMGIIAEEVGRQIAIARRGGWLQGNSFVGTTGQFHMWTCENMYKTCMSSSQRTFQHGKGVCTTSLPPSWGATSIGSFSFGERESQFSLRMWYLVEWPHFSGWPRAEEYMGSTNWTRRRREGGGTEEEEEKEEKEE